MEQNKKAPEPDNTAVRTALWRALHVQADAAPHVFEDEIGLKLIAPPDDWKERPDMKFTKLYWQAGKCSWWQQHNSTRTDFIFTKGFTGLTCKLRSG